VKHRPTDLATVDAQSACRQKPFHDLAASNESIIENHWNLRTCDGGLNVSWVEILMLDEGGFRHESSFRAGRRTRRRGS
jgi:hypothetical protein